MIVVAQKVGVGRAVAPDAFTDITTVPVTRIEWNADGGLDVDFDGDLTGEQQTLVKIRCASADDAEEALFLQAYNAYRNNQQFLNIASPTTAQAVAQVKALSQQLNAVIRVIVGV